MADLRFKYLPEESEFDLAIKNWELEFDDGLETAVLISLFTDARVEEEELPSGETDRRGWWGDGVLNPDRIPLGSKLWLLDRATSRPERLEQARQYAMEALQWLIDDKIAASVEVETSFAEENPENILLEISIARPSKDGADLRFDFVWEARDGF